MTTTETAVRSTTVWKRTHGRGQTGKCARCDGRIVRQARFTQETREDGAFSSAWDYSELRWAHRFYDREAEAWIDDAVCGGLPIKRKSHRMRKITRDSQKSKCYAWEREAIPGFWACAGRAPYHRHGDSCVVPMSIEECQRLADEVGHVYNYGIRVRAGRNGGHGGGHSITLGVAARTKPIVLHEIAHCLVPYGGEGHGPRFIRCYINLLSQFLGLSARELRASARAAKLRVATRDKVAKPKRRKKPSRSARASSGAVQAMGMPVSS